jgi:predicted transposase YbfD/YdcC
MLCGIKEHFGKIEDPRLGQNKRHQLMDIIVLSICAVVSGAEGWEAIEGFGYDKEAWLKKYIELRNGIPSDDCIARVLSRIEPSQLTDCFIEWTRSVSELTGGEIVAIDGKTVRGSYDVKRKQSAIHMVSAWATQAGMSLGQVKTDEKSNEITAIPKLLELLELKGCIVTIDAMGCQTEIARKIIEKQADYVLAVKGNQSLLHQAIIDYFEVAIAANHPEVCQMQSHEDIDAGHGRIETRRFYLSSCLSTLPTPARWQGLQSIAMVESERIVQGQTTRQRRYYLCSFTDIHSFAHAVRSHWEIENALHWVLDVTFSEDDSRIRNGNSPANFNIFRQLALNLLKREPSKLSIKRKRFKAALSDSFRETLFSLS